MNKMKGGGSSFSCAKEESTQPLRLGGVGGGGRHASFMIIHGRLFWLQMDYCTSCTRHLLPHQVQSSSHPIKALSRKTKLGEELNMSCTQYSQHGDLK
mmetsp:Transcript_48867/g.66605  ORF Transcript_48867/g.66605 Transcript_48867/m.66605 type:complete len:98 (-) Transcript_48867:660-953(-)|eukprot:CAMPEP_0185755638 /NCGR_PEP_ID=MMETSP1174-20130828/14116_1 /TAXON_ID=35687 /ORGANISM="Dictyocha speculum, Strain CCMP1381" /LENGTH=97 /DNA_ID=CAMNT_0028434271 /DNA_START=339 /DNA_END=632 /DNA_ORIENTATION=-